MQRGKSTSLSVVEEVAAHKGVDPIELRPPLQKAIDTDALDALFRSTTDDAAVDIEFTYCDCRVRVDGEGAVSVTEPCRPSDSERCSVGEAHND